MSDSLRSICFPSVSDGDMLRSRGTLPCPRGCCITRGRVTCCSGALSDNPAVDYASLSLPMGLALFAVLAVFLGVLYYYIFIGAEKKAAPSSGRTDDGQSDSTAVSIDPDDSPRGPQGSNFQGSNQTPEQPFRFVSSPPEYTEQDHNTAQPPAYLRVVLPADDAKKEEPGPLIMDVSGYLQAVTNSSPSSPPPSYQERRLSWGCHCQDMTTACSSMEEARHCNSRRASQVSQVSQASQASQLSEASQNSET